MANESTEHASSPTRQVSSAEGELASRSELETAVSLKREKIARELEALREEIRHLPVRAFIRRHPVKTTAGAAVVGFGLSRWLVRRLGSRTLTPEEYRQQLMDELLESVIDKAAHRVATGEPTQAAVRRAVRDHSPIVFEVEREPEEEAESVAATVVHTLFALFQPYLQQYLRSRFDAFKPQ